MGADAPAALTCDDRRAFRETETLPHSSKKRRKPLLGVCPPLATKSADGL